MFCEGTLRSYVLFQENSPKTGIRRGCHIGCHHSGRFQKRAKQRGTASVNSLELQDPWHAKILVNGKKVNFRVDTGADVTVVPRRYFTKNSPLIRKTNKLFGPGKTKIDVVSQFTNDSDRVIEASLCVISVYCVRFCSRSSH